MEMSVMEMSGELVLILLLEIDQLAKSTVTTSLELFWMEFNFA